MKSQRLTVVAGLAIIIVVVFLGWTVGISPRLEAADLVNASKDAAVVENTAAEAELVTLRKQFADLADLKAQYATLAAQIPSSPAAVDLVDQLKLAADANKVTLTSISIGNPEPYVVPTRPVAAPAPDAPADAVPAAPAPFPPGTQPSAKVAAQLYTMSVSITVTGTNAAVLGFTSSVQEGQRLYIATSMGIVTAPTGLAKSGADFQTDILTGFVLVVTGTAATPVAK